MNVCNGSNQQVVPIIAFKHLVCYDRCKTTFTRPSTYGRAADNTAVSLYIIDVLLGECASAMKRARKVDYKLVGEPVGGRNGSGSVTRGFILVVFVVAGVALLWNLPSTNTSTNTSPNTSPSDDTSSSTVTCTATRPCMCYKFINQCDRTTYPVLMPEAENEDNHQNMLEAWRLASGSQPHAIGSNKVSYRLQVETGSSKTVCAPIDSTNKYNANVYFAMSCENTPSPPPYDKNSDFYNWGKTKDWVNGCSENNDNTEGPKYELDFELYTGNNWIIYVDASAIDGMHEYNYDVEFQKGSTSGWIVDSPNKDSTYHCNGRNMVDKCRFMKHQTANGKEVCLGAVKHCETTDCQDNMCPNYDYESDQAYAMTCSTQRAEYWQSDDFGCRGCNDTKQPRSNQCTSLQFCQSAKCQAGPMKRTVYYQNGLKYCKNHYLYPYADEVTYTLRSPQSNPNFTVQATFSCPLQFENKSTPSIPSGWEGPDNPVNQSCDSPPLG